MDNVFLSGIPLEQECPQAHQRILSAARFLSSARLYGTETDPSSRDMREADFCARRAADILHSKYRTGAFTMWLAVVRYAVELHAARLDAERVMG
jgi:hypothetical protein